MDEQQLEALKKALSHFKERLQSAREQYFSENDGGRAGAHAAVNASAALATELYGKESALALPLITLGAALDDLTRGTQHEMLKIVSTTGRRPDTKMRQVARAYSAITMEFLMRGKFSREEAAREVARHLNKRGVDTPGYTYDLTWKTVATWRDELNNPDNDDNAANVYRDFISRDIRISTTDKNTLKQDLLNRLDSLLVTVKEIPDSG